MTRQLFQAFQAFLLCLLFLGATIFPSEAFAGKPGGSNGSYIPGPPDITVDGDCVVTFNGQMYVDKWGQLVNLGDFRKKCAEAVLLEAQAEYLRSPEYRESQRDLKKSIGVAIENGSEISVSVDEDEAGRTNIRYASGRAAAYRELAGVYEAMPEEAFAQPGYARGGYGGGAYVQRDIVAGAFANRGSMPFAPYAGTMGTNVGPSVPVLEPEPKAASKEEVSALEAENAKLKKRAEAAEAAAAKMTK